MQTLPCGMCFVLLGKGAVMRIGVWVLVMMTAAGMESMTPIQSGNCLHLSWDAGQLMPCS